MAEIEQVYRDVVICVMCMVVSISLSAALPVVEPGQHPAGVIKVLSLHALSSSPHVANEAANEATVDIQVGAASRRLGGPSKDCRDSLIACVRKGRNIRACRKELPCVSTCCSNNIGPSASTLALPVKIESKNGTLPVENNNGSDGMPDATTAQFAQQSTSEASLEPRMTETIQADLQGLKKSYPHTGKDQKNGTAEMVGILVPLGLICVCLAMTVWFCSTKTTKKAMLDAADLKVPKTPCKTSAGLLAKLQTNKSAASQAALEQREAHRHKDEHRRRKQLKVQLPEGCETAHDQSHGLIHDVAELYTECPGEDLRENERRGAAHGKAAQSCAVQPFMGPETRAALASLSSSLEEWEMDPEERAIRLAQAHRPAS